MMRQSKPVYALFSQPLQNISGIGSAMQRRLFERQITCVGDLLMHLPRAYEDDRQVLSIASLQEGVSTRVQGHIVRKSAHGVGRKRQITLIIDDGTAKLTLNFFHSGYMMQDARLTEGREISLRGVPKFWGQTWQMTHPDWSMLEQFSPSIRPVYPMLAGLSSKRLSGFIQHALTLMTPSMLSPFDATTQIALRDALLYIHNPKSLEDGRLKQAHERLKQEEILLYLHLMQQQRQLAVQPVRSIQAGALCQALLASLPFDLTVGQQTAWYDIQQDFQSGQRMHRLVQGDVGSGKTWVAALAALAVLEAGGQVALMVPTEVLAKQHHATLTALLQPLGIEVGLLTGSTAKKERKTLLAALQDASLTFVVGTHALISDDVIYKRLSLAIVDEQHRFGVKQRWALTNKQQPDAEAVHLLAMTATPIPRSLAMAVYGDMDLSVMQGMPVGRKAVDTRVLPSNHLASLAAGMQRLLDTGGRIYWIVPRIDIDEEDDHGATVEQRLEVLKKHFPQAQVLGLHGRMKSKDKQGVLDAFSHGACKLLVSTTVVEVGVNVPEARLIVIDQAEGYGLAQLHQLRGRVGRSDEQGYCILLTGDDVSEHAMQRLQMMVKSHDGLVLAEADLQLRGSGDAIGTQQSGDAGFRLVDLAQDAALLRQCYESFVPIVMPEAVVHFWRPFAERVD